MSILPAGLLELAGFTLAHAMWSIADTSEDELLVPLVILERGGARELLRFEAETQEEAIANAKAALDAQSDVLDAWAFAREGIWRPASTGGAPQDVITTGFSALGVAETLAVTQPFARASVDSGFRLIGAPTFVIAGRMLTAPSIDMRDRLLAGIHSHPKAGTLWSTWAKATLRRDDV